MKGVKWRRSIKEEQTITVLLDQTRLAVCLHYYYNIYFIETNDSKEEGSSPPTLLSSRSWPYSIDKLSWKLYRIVRKTRLIYVYFY